MMSLANLKATPSKVDSNEILDVLGVAYSSLLRCRTTTMITA
jgi:hypothetical protein